MTALCLVLFQRAALAQHEIPFDRYLVPIVPTYEPVPGAYGSLWMTELYVRNESDSAMDLWRASEFCAIECPPFSAHSTQQRAFTGEANAGTFIYVGASSRNRSTFQLSVRDISRAETTWGASIPVVPEWQAYTRKLQLLNVPTDPAFRVALRIYDFDPDLGSERSVRLRIFPIGGNDAIVEMPVVFPPSRSPGTLPMVPGSVMIGDLAAAFPQLSNEPRLRIDVDPLTDGLRFWAFVTITNKDTQHVTVIAPQFVTDPDAAPSRSQTSDARNASNRLAR